MQTVTQFFSGFWRKPAFTGFVLFTVALIFNIIAQEPHRFFTMRNINMLFATNTAFILVVMGQTVLLISGTLDLSIGVQVALVNVVTIMTVQEWGIPFVLGCILGILAAIVASIVLWLCVAVFRLPDLLASFAMIFAIRGVNVLIMPVPQGTVSSVYWRAYNNLILGILPASSIALIIAIGLWLYLKRTRFGTNIYAVGANPQSAFAAGISPTKVQLQAFLFKGFLVGLAGICLTLMTASGNPVQGEEIGIRSLAAAIIGGVTFGGWGSIASGVFGAGFFILIQNAVYFVFNILFRLLPGNAVLSFWQNFLTEMIVFLGLLMTIITMRGQREALSASIKKKFKLKREDKNEK